MANAQAGMVAEGFEKIKEAEAFIHHTGERIYEAELLRIKEEMLLMQSQANQDQAEHCFRKVKQIAIQQGAKSWELRAALSLGRLLQKQGRQPTERLSIQQAVPLANQAFELLTLQTKKDPTINHICNSIECILIFGGLTWTVQIC